MESPQEYYRSHGPMTAPGAFAADAAALPSDVAALCEVVQGVLIHRDIAPFAYGVKLSEERREEAHIRPVAQMLAQIRALDRRPLRAPRSLDHRMACVCRHFTVMLCAILREQGVPARARCGFGAYFTPGWFEDHWVTEYWNAGQARWILVDSQLDAAQRKLLKLDFDPLDVPRDRFIIAGDAWQMCRAGRADPHRFGLTYINEHGLWFIAGNVLRDLASLNRMELLPWDVWGLMQVGDGAWLGERAALLDRVAALTLAGDGAFSEVQAIYQSDDRLRAPSVVFNALRNAPETIAG